MGPLIVIGAAIAFIGLGVLIFRLYKWERRQHELNTLKPWVTLQVMLSPGITDARERFGQGHAKAVPQLEEIGAQFGYVIGYADPGDTSPTMSAYFRVPAEKIDALETAYDGYFKNELSFLPVPADKDPFRKAHAGYLAAHQHTQADMIRMWALGLIPGRGRPALPGIKPA